LGHCDEEEQPDEEETRDEEGRDQEAHYLVEEETVDGKEARGEVALVPAARVLPATGYRL